MKKILKKSLALFLALLMFVSLIPGMAFADSNKKELNYVAFGDSMAQGYCFLDYNENADSGHYCGWKGISDRSYIKMFANKLQADYPDCAVNLYDMTIQGLQPDELYAFLKPEKFDFDSMTRGARKHIGWWTGDYHTDEEQGPGGDGEGYYHIFDTFKDMSDAYIDAVKKADVITYDIGENYFGTYLNDRRDADEVFTELLEGNPMYIQLAESMRSQLSQLIVKYTSEAVDDRINGLLYAYMSYIVYNEKALGAIYDLNPDVQVIVVPLSNPHQELYVNFNGVKIPYSTFINLLMDSLNLYMRDMCTYRCRYTIATLDQPVMSFADELYYRPDDLSEDAKALLERTILGNGSILGQALYPAPEGFVALYEQVAAEMSWLLEIPEEEYEMWIPMLGGATPLEVYYGSVGTIGYMLGLEYDDTFMPVKGVPAVDGNGQPYVEPAEDGQYYIKWNVIDRIIYDEIAAKYGEEVAFKDFLPGNMIEAVAAGTDEYGNPFVPFDPCVYQVCSETLGEKPGPKILASTLADARAAVETGTAQEWQQHIVDAVGTKLDAWKDICCKAATYRTFPDLSMSVGNFGYEDVLRILTDPDSMTDEDYLALHAAIRSGSAARGFGAHPCPYGHQVKYNAVVKAYEKSVRGHIANIDKVQCYTPTVVKVIAKTVSTISKISGAIIKNTRVIRLAK